MLNNKRLLLNNKQRHDGRNRGNCPEKGRQYYEEKEERLQKWTLTNIGVYLKKKKIRKKNTQEIDIICLRKTNKSLEKKNKLNSWYVSRKITIGTRTNNGANDEKIS